MKKHGRTRNTVIAVLCDLVSVTLSVLLAMLFSEGAVTFDLLTLWWYIANIGFAGIFFVIFRLYNIIYGSAGIIDALRVCAAVLGVCICNVVYSLAFRTVDVQTCLTYSVVLLNLVLLSRFAKRLLLAVYYILFRRGKPGTVRAMIVGGGSAGTALVREMQTTDKIKYLPVCIVDDDTGKVGRSISNVRIVGTSADIPRMAAKYNIEEILIAIPSVGKKEISRVVDICKQTKCKVKILPGVYQLVSGEATIAALRDVDITDLLGREQITVNLDEIMGYIEGQTILVTGGGGSIGSELCRQIATHRPGRLIILDIYENNAYEIEQELKRRHPDLDLLTLIASVRDKTKIENVFGTYKPDIVFNAAAHKHVPLMETSPNEAVKNNVFGTLNCALMADKYGAKTFVQISTDKAVNPTNVMGATKRICEMIIQTIGRHSTNTNFVAVRFGNVLGSNGSVIPLFREQIREGGPVTVTHPDIIRYFMTIPEAVMLILQAGAYAKGGQIFVLDMGEPVRIYDLALNLIRLSGYEPGTDIEIKFTGLRPGEKLYEERLMDEEGLQTTANGLINIARPIPLDEDFLKLMLGRLEAAARGESDNIRDVIAELVPTYRPRKEQIAI